MQKRGLWGIKTVTGRRQGMQSLISLVGLQTCFKLHVHHGKKRNIKGDKKECASANEVDTTYTELSRQTF